MKKLFTALLIMASANSFGNESQTFSDTLNRPRPSVCIDPSEAAAITALALDWSQTRFISANLTRLRLHETNLILGKAPSGGAVNRYFLLSGAAEIYVSRLFNNEEDRSWFRWSIVAFESAVIVRNRILGIGFGTTF